MSVIIAGAGIGGLTAALMLDARGVKVTVYEQASEVREAGVGINILPHAIKELANLGLLPSLDSIAIRTKELIYINRQGKEDQDCDSVFAICVRGTWGKSPMKASESQRRALEALAGSSH
jgi:2-polyprenyl-6-methoxyphenol hydroxylase-like FAD-dependent oxidoreductase